MRQREPAGHTNRARRVIRKRNVTESKGEPCKNRTQPDSFELQLVARKEIVCNPLRDLTNDAANCATDDASDHSAAGTGGRA